MGEQAIEAAVNVVSEMLETNNSNAFLTPEQVMALTLLTMANKAE